MKYQKPKGLFDIIPYGSNDTWKLSYMWEYIEKIIRKICFDYNYSEIRTPIFERSELFIRSVGESSDIVKKEMYIFEDKAGRSMTLRPEGTAAALRAIIENNLLNFSLPKKFFYVGPMFRYDRPQEGRYRQHHQFGVEVLGQMHFLQDVEIIDLLLEFYNKIGLQDLTLNINSVGDDETRKNYKEALKKYLKPYLKDLSKDSQDRFEQNPLRILDTKDKKDREIIENAPSILDFLSKKSSDHFENICKELKNLKVPFVINEKLVRGLDYYSDLVFEVTAGKLGSQNSIGGGGSYGSLVKQFGGPDLSAIGFGTGIERILQTMIDQKISIENENKPFLYFIAMDKENIDLCFHLTTKLRHKQMPVELSYFAKKLPKELKIANEMNVAFVAIVGEEEKKKNSILLKNMENGDQKEIKQEEFISYVEELYKNK